MTPQPYIYPFWDIVSVYDGDTYTINLDLGFSIEKKKMKCRLAGVNTPELRSSSTIKITDNERFLAKQARDYVRQLFEDAEQLLLHSLTKPDKYGRSSVKIWVDGASLADLLLAKGSDYALPYAGGKRTNWEQIRVDEELVHVAATLG